jgi:F0F1-type ATP synthase membrane subunit b/b'
MDTVLIIIIAAIVVLAILFLARGGIRRAQDKRREKASELRVEATEAEERARRAETEAEREREAAEARTARADRLDPDADSPSMFRRFRRDSDEQYEGQRTRE